ncbi:MAG: carboxylesterase [Desulfobacterales bacterium]|nr:MAG: carboxylesterase [Desulfobacterales bacterium]
MTLLPAIELVTHPEPDAAIIWLHGLGADGNDFAPIVPELRLPDSYKIRFIFPHAPKIPVSVNGGFVMPAWFDIYSMDIDRKVDTEQLTASAEKVRLFIHQEVARGIESKRILIAGFSQGGAVGYQLALTHPEPLCGLLAMSTYFATSKTIERNPANDKLPIAVQHGTMDPVVPNQLGIQAAEELQGLGYPLTYSSYPMEHSVCPQQIGDIAAWMQERLG